MPSSTSRLACDLREIRKHPLPNVSAAPLADNLYEWHITLTPEEPEALKNVPLHFILSVPEDYPFRPPRLRLASRLAACHPNVLQNRDVCLDMLETTGAAGKPYVGWSCSYSILSIMQQLQIFCNFLIEGEDGLRACIDEAMNLACGHCPHTGGSPWPPRNLGPEADEDRIALCRPAPYQAPKALLKVLRSQDTVVVQSSPAPIASTPKRPVATQPQSNGPAVTSTKPGQQQPTPAPVAARTVPKQEEWTVVAPKRRRQVQTEFNSRETRREETRPSARLTRVAAVPQRPVTPPAERIPVGALLANPPKTKAKKRRGKPRNRRGPGDTASDAQSEAETTERTSVAADLDDRADVDEEEEPCGVLSRVASESNADVTDDKADDKVDVDEGDDNQDEDGEGVWETVSRRPCKATEESEEVERYAQEEVEEVVVSGDGGVQLAETRATWRENANRSTSHSLLHLDFDSILQIAVRVDARSLVRLANVCRATALVCARPELWQAIAKATFSSTSPLTTVCKDWRYITLLHLNGVSDVPRCSFLRTPALGKDATTLGIPLTYTVNPRTRRVDYIASSFDLLSAQAVEEMGQRKVTLWGDKFALWLPVFISPAHFRRALPQIQRTIVRLSGHWETRRFHPEMALEVIPKLMSTAAVLVSDKGKELCDAAVAGYCHLHRLLLALIDHYPELRFEVERRVHGFLQSDSLRRKAREPILGDFIPLLSVCQSVEWSTAFTPLFNEALARQALWVCKKHPDIDSSLKSSASPPDGILDKWLDGAKVALRIMCFQASFATTFARPDSGGLASAMAGYDLLLGAPPQVLARRVTHRVLAALDADTWPQIFRCLAVACPPKDRLAAVLRDAVVRSARYGYHTPGMDFSRIQRSGTSAILRKGESYGIKGEVRHLTLFLGSDSHSILCGACLLYRRGVFHEVVCYNHTRSGDGAVHHSGDSSDEQGNAYHRVEINLARLHDDIDTIYLTVCSCGPANLSGFRNPSIHLTDSNAPNTNLCSYSIDERTRAPSAVMAALRKRGDGAWEMEALGLDCMHRCCSNYKVIRATISQFEK